MMAVEAQQVEEAVQQIFQLVVVVLREAWVVEVVQ